MGNIENAFSKQQAPEFNFFQTKTRFEMRISRASFDTIQYPRGKPKLTILS